MAAHSLLPDMYWNEFDGVWLGFLLTWPFVWSLEISIEPVEHKSRQSEEG